MPMIRQMSALEIDTQVVERLPPKRDPRRRGVVGVAKKGREMVSEKEVKGRRMPQMGMQKGRVLRDSAEEPMAVR